MAAERCVLLLSRAARLAPALRRIATERSLRLVRAGDAHSAWEHLRAERFACALFDLDALGDEAEEFLSRVRSLRPELHAVGYGRLANPGPAAQLLGYPLLPKPLTAERLAHALDDSLAPPPARLEGAEPAPDTARLPLDGPQEELRKRVAQLTTLYQIGRAISESRNWSEALDYFLASLRDYLGVRGAAILLYSREATVLAPRTVLAMSEADVEASARTLLAAYPVRDAAAEIHPLDCYRHGAEAGRRCDGHAMRWHLTVLPLLYRRTPLGFLVLDKPYADGDEFAGELFFLQTIQTILGEEVANAVHLSRLLDLKNLNEAVLDNVESGVLTATVDGTVTFANRLARDILGFAPGGALPERLRFDAVFEMQDGAAFARLSAGPAEGTSCFGAARRGDGHRVPVKLRARRIVDPSDSEPLVVVAFEDLTEQRLLEEQARRADRLRSLGELSAAIAHEVRNPLQGISLTLSNLQEHLQPGAEPYVRVMFSEMERLNAIVGGILSFSRPAPPMPAEVGLQALCARALELAAERAARRGVALALDPSPDDDGCEADEGQILQVVLNLLLNAIDASPAAGRVTVRLEPAAAARLPAGTAAGPFWRIAVHDDGPGIPPETRDQLFDPFFTTKSHGTGIGLAVCQKIVAEHHGSIHVDSGAGTGTTFIVELPRRFAGAVAWPSH